VKQESVRISNLEGYRISYREEEKPPAGAGKKKEAEKKEAAAPETKVEKAKPKEPKQVISFLLIQVDGVVTIKGLAKVIEIEGFRNVLEKANENFTMCLTRRW
jgi:hypothetical protein